MSYEEEFDKIIRQKAEEAEYSFNMKSWENANTLIEADRKAARLLKLKKAIKPALAISVLVATAFTAFIYVNNAESQSSLTLEQKTSTNDLSDNSSASANSNPTKINSNPAKVNSNYVETSNRPSQQKINANPTNTNLNDKNEVIAFSETIKSETSNKSEEEILNETNSTKSNNDVNKPNSGQKTVLLASAAIILKEEATGSNAPVKESTEDTEVAQAEQNTFNESENASVESQIAIDQMSAVSMNIPYESTNNQEVVETLVNIINYDEAYYKYKRKTHFMNVEAGISYNFGWSSATSSSSSSDGKGINYFGGINYGFYLNNKFSIGLGAQIYNLAHIEDPFYSASHKEYDFGSTTIYTVVTCSQLYYAAIPLKINYAINRSNSFGLGFNAAFLFNAEVNTESYYYQDNAKVQIDNGDEKSIYDGIEEYNYMLTANYSHRFGRRISLNTEVTYGLTDLFTNMTEQSGIQKSSGIRLSLTYTLFDK